MTELTLNCGWCVKPVEPGTGWIGVSRPRGVHGRGRRDLARAPGLPQEVREVTPDDPTPPAPRTCSKCGKAPSGPGGILCPPCLHDIETAPLYPNPEVTP
jgi:hypothetical protein